MFSLELKLDSSTEGAKVAIVDRIEEPRANKFRPSPPIALVNKKPEAE